MTMRIPPHVHRDIYAGLVKFDRPAPGEVDVRKEMKLKAGDWSLERSRKKGQSKTTKKKGRAWRTEKGRKA